MSGLGSKMAAEPGQQDGSVECHGFGDEYTCIFMDIHGTSKCPWSHGSPSISMDVHWSPWRSMGIHGHPWTSMWLHGHPLISMDIQLHFCLNVHFHANPWISTNFNRDPWIFMDFQDYHEPQVRVGGGIPWGLAPAHIHKTDYKQTCRC